MKQITYMVNNNTRTPLNYKRNPESKTIQRLKKNEPLRDLREERSSLLESKELEVTAPNPWKRVAIGSEKKEKNGNEGLKKKECEFIWENWTEKLRKIYSWGVFVVEY